jgi:hypothetical protein
MQQITFDGFQAAPLGFGHQLLHDEEGQCRHHGEEQEVRSGTQRAQQRREGQCHDQVEQPDEDDAHTDGAGADVQPEDPRREGRILRQGNKNASVQIFNYVTEATFDIYSWTVERKARFIGQIKTGDLDARTAEDLSSDELGNSAAATKAVATGDPRYLQQVQLDDDVKRLSALKRAHGDAKGRNAAERHACAREITATTEQLGRLDEALPRTAASADAPFAMTIGGRTYRERGPASSAVVDTVRQAYSEGKRWGAQKAFPVASLRGVEVLAARLLTSDEVVLSVNVPCRTRAMAAKDFTGRDANGAGSAIRWRVRLARGSGHRTGAPEGPAGRTWPPWRPGPCLLLRRRVRRRH